MTRLINWAAAAAAAAALATALPATAQLTDGVAVIVNDDVVSTYDVRQRALLLLASSGIQSTPENQERARAQALRELVDDRLKIQETRQYNVEVTPDSIDRAVAGIAQQNNLTPEQFAAQLARGGINVNTLRRQIEADTAWRRLMSGRYGSRVRISETQVREMQQRILQGATRTQFQASEIFLQADTDAEFTQAEANAARLLQEMQRGAPFPLVARQFSASATAAAGGDLGWLTAGELRPEVRTVLETLQAGQVSTPFRVSDGVYIVALRARREGTAQAAVQRVTLLQVNAPAASRQTLERARGRFTTCEGLQTQLRNVTGAEVVDLGTLAESDLSETVRARVTDLEPIQASAVTVSGDLASTIVLCARDTSVEGLPSTTDIENRLYEQEMALLSQRYLRNLRREATIITR